MMNINSSLGLKSHGINVVWPTTLTSGWPIEPIKVEAPMQFRGGVIDIREIGAFSYFGEGHSMLLYINKIGRFCAIAPQVTTGLSEHSIDSLTAHPMFSWKFDDWEASNELYEDAQFISDLQQKKDSMNKKSTRIEIGNDVWIGVGAYISRGVKIGDGAVIAAKSVVTKDVPPYTVVGGVPARVIRQRFNDNEIEKLMDLKWWEYGPLILKNIDITNIESTLYEVENRISQGFEKYNPDKIEFDFGENAIYKTIQDERIQIIKL